MREQMLKVADELDRRADAEDARVRRELPCGPTSLLIQAQTFTVTLREVAASIRAVLEERKAA